MTHDEMIAVISAHRDGRPIEWKPNGGSNWFEVEPNAKSMNWNFLANDFRIKPQPKEFWVYRRASSLGEWNVLTYNPARNTEVEIIHVREVL